MYGLARKKEAIQLRKRARHDLLSPNVQFAARRAGEKRSARAKAEGMVVSMEDDYMQWQGGGEGFQHEWHGNEVDDEQLEDAEDVVAPSSSPPSSPAVWRLWRTRRV